MTTKPQHTPGPWKVQPETTWVVTRDTHPKSTYPDKRAAICEVAPVDAKYDYAGRIRSGTWDAETDANANLIAAAPELLAMLVKLDNYLEERRQYPDLGEIKTGSQAHYEIKDAIAKARGEA